MIVQLCGGASAPLGESPTLRGMFEARKRIFVDLLKWDVPVIDGQYELDRFDDEHARYIIILDDHGRHCASARLLKTIRPHILDTLFPDLCELAIPSGPSTLEITRFCLDRSAPAAERLQHRKLLVSALTAFALANGIERYTGVAEMGWLSQILGFGWDCQPLGLPKEKQGRMLGALSINIGPRTPSLLAANGIFKEEAFDAFGFLKAA